MNKLPKARNENILVQNLEKEVLIYDTTTDKAYCLNETSANIFNNCNDATSFDELKRRYKYTDDLIFLALDELKEKNLLDSAADYQSPFDGMSRREVIRKVGFATMLALPIITGIIAPSAVNAASGARQANNTVCTANTQCTSGKCTTSSTPTGRRLCCASTTIITNPGEPGYNFGNTSDSICTGTIGPGYCCSGVAANNPPGFIGCICQA